MARGAWFVRAIPAAVAAWSGAAWGQTTLHVDDDAPAGGDGRSWATAYRDLNDALDVAPALPPPVTVRIGAGTYFPRLIGYPPSATFRWRGDVTLRGGYRGLTPGGQPDERDVALFVTAMSGRFPSGGQAIYVITATGLGPTASLDGITVRDCGAGSGDGAGLLCGNNSAVLANCTFTNHWGPGATASSGGFLTVTDCTFADCETDIGGAALRAPAARVLRCRFSGNYGAARVDSLVMFDCTVEDNGCEGGVRTMSCVLVRCLFRRNRTCSPSLNGGAVTGGTVTAVNCVFDGNRVTSSGLQGGAVRGTLIAYNCLFVNNQVRYSGYGNCLYLLSGSMLVNCTIADNGGTEFGVEGGGIYANGAVSLANCILWGNVGGTTLERAQLDWAPGAPPQVHHCVVQGWTGTLGGLGNSSADPRFLEPQGRDWRLRSGSPCIDSADAEALPADTLDLDDDGDTTEPLPLDLAMRVRTIDDPMTPNTGPGTPPFLDRGAFEYQGAACYANCDGSTAVPLLSVDDFVCFQARFAAGEPYANCDGSTGTPALNVADFVCFQSRFAAGCP